MNAWWETVLASVLVAFGITAGWCLSKRPTRWWLTGWFLGMACVATLSMERYIDGLEFIPPFSWTAHGRVRFLIPGIAAPLLLIPLLTRSQNRRLQILIGALGLIFVFQFSILPFLQPALAQHQLLSLRTTLDKDGVCLQQTGFTCGPAAAVTALRKLGFEAEEGQISVWARTYSAGTIDDLLVDAINEHYGPLGLNAERRHFNNLSELAQTLPALAVMEYEFLTDHFVAVLEVTKDHVLVADPLCGITRYTHQSFLEAWRHCGITINTRDHK